MLIPTLTGRKHLPTALRDLLSLPYRYGGMNLINPTQYLLEQYSLSQQICHPLIKQYFSDPSNFDTVGVTLMSKRNNKLAAYTDALKKKLDATTQYSLALSLEKGASMWLSTLPLTAHGFHLNKSAFRDAVHLHYGWEIPDTPVTCQYGHSFTIDHILSCPKGGFPIICHNEVRNITSSLLSEVCSNVTVEPQLLPLTGEELSFRSANCDSNAQLDIAANGAWGCRFEKPFFSVRVFNPFSKCNMETPLPETYRQHKNEKKRKYEQRVIEIEHASFTPLVFSSTGGMSNITSHFFKYIAEKRKSSYSETIALIRCRLCFALLKSAIMCIRGTRSTSAMPILSSAIDLQVAEGRLSFNI